MNLTCNHIPEDHPGLSSVSSKAPSSQRLVLKFKGDDLLKQNKTKTLVLNHQHMLILTRACFPKSYIWQMFKQMPMPMHRCMGELLSTHKKEKQFLVLPIKSVKWYFSTTTLIGKPQAKAMIVLHIWPLLLSRLIVNFFQFESTNEKRCAGSRTTCSLWILKSAVLLVPLAIVSVSSLPYRLGNLDGSQ